MTLFIIFYKMIPLTKSQLLASDILSGGEVGFVYNNHSSDRLSVEFQFRVVKPEPTLKFLFD